MDTFAEKIVLEEQRRGREQRNKPCYKSFEVLDIFKMRYSHSTNKADIHQKVLI